MNGLQHEHGVSVAGVLVGVVLSTQPKHRTLDCHESEIGEKITFSIFKYILIDLFEKPFGLETVMNKLY